MGQTADDARLGDREDPAAPPGGPQRKGGDGQTDRGEQDDERHPALTGRAVAGLAPLFHHVINTMR
jgi:hypothetical protein